MERSLLLIQDYAAAGGLQEVHMKIWENIWARLVCSWCFIVCSQKPLEKKERETLVSFSLIQ